MPTHKAAILSQLQFRPASVVGAKSELYKVGEAPSIRRPGSEDDINPPNTNNLVKLY